MNQAMNVGMGFLKSLMGVAGSQAAEPEDDISRMYNLKEDVRHCRENIEYYQKSIIEGRKTVDALLLRLSSLEAELQLAINQFKGAK